jgi:UDP-N-acetylglucosamine 2-epimerase
MPIDLIAGARSNFMKIESIINPLVNAKMQVVGITEETTVLGVSSLALRDNIEKPSTVTIGTRKFVGAEQDKRSPLLARLMAGRWEKCTIPPE